MVIGVEVVMVVVVALAKVSNECIARFHKLLGYWIAHSQTKGLKHMAKSRRPALAARSAQALALSSY